MKANERKKSTVYIQEFLCSNTANEFDLHQSAKQKSLGYMLAMKDLRES